VAVTPVEFQSLDQWGGSERGLLPVEATMMVAIPELDGATGSMVFGGRGNAAHVACTGCERACTFQAPASNDASAESGHDMFSCPERADMLAARVGRLVALRRSQRAERKVALVIFNFPPNAGATGTAAFLSVFESLFNTLAAMKREGYSSTCPPAWTRCATLSSRATQSGSAAWPTCMRASRWTTMCAASAGCIRSRRSGARRRASCKATARPSTCWASASATSSSASSRASATKATRCACCSRRASRPRMPSRPSTAMREDFGAHAVLHFGTHGALEFMPGKQNGMTASCWPDRMIGDLPNFYLYASNNPSEGTIAKRRAAATLISYLTPPIAQAGLYKGLVDLKAAIERFRSLEPEAERERTELAADDPGPGRRARPGPRRAGLGTRLPTPARWLQLAEQVLELEYTLIPHGLHVVGRCPPRRSASTCCCRWPRPRTASGSTARHGASAGGGPSPEVAGRCRPRDAQAIPRLVLLEEPGRPSTRCWPKDHEIPA
jgi:magnesium chelatase subunit H